jgi:hypothetical protein
LVPRIPPDEAFFPRVRRDPLSSTSDPMLACSGTNAGGQAPFGKRSFVEETHNLCPSWAQRVQSGITRCSPATAETTDRTLSQNARTRGRRSGGQGVAGSNPVSPTIGFSMMEPCPSALNAAADSPSMSLEPGPSGGQAQPTNCNLAWCIDPAGLSGPLTLRL